MENKNNQPKRNYWKIIAINLIIGIIMLIVSILTSIEFKDSYNSGRTQGQLDIINETTMTGKILYLTNISNANSINFTTITKLQWEAIEACVKSGVCTWNQTKYDELNRK